MPNLTEIITLSGLPIVFIAGMNVATYRESINWLKAHRVDPSWNEKYYEKNRKESVRGKIIYRLGMPGRKLAYYLNSKKLK